VRTKLKAALDEAVAFGNKVAAEKAMSDKQAIIDSKRTKVIELSDEERAKWVEAMKPVWKDFEDTVGADNLKAAIDANK